MTCPHLLLLLFIYYKKSSLFLQLSLDAIKDSMYLYPAHYCVAHLVLDLRLRAA